MVQLSARKNPQWVTTVKMRSSKVFKPLLVQGELLSDHQDMNKSALL